MISSSDSVSVVVFALALTTVIAYPQQQQQIDPAYLRDYYAQISQQNARGAASGSDATPIYEQEQSQPQAQPQYIQQQVKKPKKKTHSLTHATPGANRPKFIESKGLNEMEIEFSNEQKNVNLFQNSQEPNSRSNTLHQPRGNTIVSLNSKYVYINHIFPAPAYQIISFPFNSCSISFSHSESFTSVSRSLTSDESVADAKYKNFQSRHKRCKHRENTLCSSLLYVQCHRWPSTT